MEMTCKVCGGPHTTGVCVGQKKIGGEMDLGGAKKIVTAYDIYEPDAGADLERRVDVIDLSLVSEYFSARAATQQTSNESEKFFHNLATGLKGKKVKKEDLMSALHEIDSQIKHQKKFGRNDDGITYSDRKTLDAMRHFLRRKIDALTAAEIADKPKIIYASETDPAVAYEPGKTQTEKIEAARQRALAAASGSEKSAAETISEEPKLEKVTPENFDKYSQTKEIIFNGATWKVDPVDSNGKVGLQHESTLEEAVALAESANKGERKGQDINAGGKIKRILVDKGDLVSGGQWVVEKPLRSPQNTDRQKEVASVQALQKRLVAGEFDRNASHSKEFLLDIFNRYAQRLAKEKSDYEKKGKP